MSHKEELSRYSLPRGVPSQSRRNRRRLLWLAPILTIVLGGTGVGVQRYLGANTLPPPATAVITRGDVERTVTALGKLKPKDYVDVGTQVSGQLKTVHREVGERVERGELIAEIDPTVYEIRVRTARANLQNLKAVQEQQKAEATLAGKQLARSRNLSSSRAISEESVEASEAAVQVAEAKLAATKAQIDATEALLAGDVANLGYTKIYAPMAGTVVSESAVEGQTVNASQSAPVIVRVADLETMTVWAEVSEADVVKVHEGMPAYFTSLGMSDRRWRGEVRQVLPTPEIINDVVLYNVLIDVDNSEQLLMSEMTVQVFFVLEQARDVPVVPMSALSPAPDAGADAYRARVMSEHGPVERIVRLGVDSRSMAEVVDGLREGEVVVLGTGGEAAANARRRPARGPQL